MNLRRNSHCQPFIPPCPPSLRMPDARRGLIALPPNMPKKNTATLLESSRLVYQVDSVYMPPGIYPASQRPRKDLATRKPALFFTNTCSVATRPKMKTWADSHLRGPIWPESVWVEGDFANGD